MANDQTDSSDLSAALTGIALGVGANFYRATQDANDRISSSQDDIDGLRRAFRDHTSNGHILRQQIPVVADVLSGFAMARTQTSAATLVPSLSQINRPSLLALLTTAVPAFTWPPKEGGYTSNGMVQSAGEMSSLGLVLTYEEVRAFIHGLVLSGPPTASQKMQAYLAANGLISAIAGMPALSQAEWLQVWKTIFGAAKSAKAAPTFVAAPGPFSIVGVGRNEAVNIKITATNAGVNAGTPICTVKFGTDSANSTGFVAPPAIVTGANFQLDSVTPTQFVLSNRVSIAANDVVTASVLVSSVDA